MSKQLKVDRIERVTRAGPLRDRVWLSDGRILESIYESGNLYRVDGVHTVEADEMREELDRLVAEFTGEGE